MAALVDGQYALSSRSSTSAGKTIVHVKLTDSAYKALDEFQKIKDLTSRRPKIQFDGNTGIIRVPIKKSSDNPEGLRPFQISLSSIQHDPNGSFDCIWQPNRSNLETMGSMANKIVVHATDDVYQTTREKMTKAEVESKKFCAKEIKPSGPHISRRIKRVVKAGEATASRGGPAAKGPGSGSSHQLNGTLPPKPVSHKPQPFPTHNKSSSSVNQRLGHSPQSSSNASSGGLSGAAGGAASGSKQSPHQSSTSIGRSSPNPAVYNLPYRDRIVHILALRPYKKPELFARLQRDGIKERDKNALGTILQNVAIFNPRENTFTLAKHLYADVRLDFPGYTDNDRQMLKRRMPSSDSAGQSAGNSPAISPTHSHSSTGSSPGGSQKRPTSTTDEEPGQQPLMKKQRISHERQREMRQEASRQPKVAPPLVTALQQQQQQQRQRPPPAPVTHSSDRNPLLPRHDQSPKSISPKGMMSSTSPGGVGLTTTTPPPTVMTSSSPNNSPSEVSTTTPDTVLHAKDKGYLKAQNNNVNEKQNRNHTSQFAASSTSETPDYLLRYKAIQTAEQRQKYKSDFNAEYEEYRIIHDSIEKVTKRFKQLEMSLRKQEEGSEDYENVKNQILNEYRTVRKDPKYLDHRKRCDYLHKKLGHIKKLILEYDQAQAMQS